MSVLSVKTIFLLLAVVVAAVAADDSDGCWKKFEDKTYPDLTSIKIGNSSKCRAHCFDIEQRFGFCTVFELSNVCRRTVKTIKPEATSTIEKEGTVVYLLKDECRADACWSESSEEVTGLSVVEAINEKHCKFICLETKHCVYQAYDDDTCYIQTQKTLPEGSFDHGQLYMLSDLCKKETLWTRLTNKDVTFDALVAQSAVGNLQCRIRCMELEVCKVYKWNQKTSECFIMKGAISGKRTLEEKEGVSTYFYDTPCPLSFD